MAYSLNPIKLQEYWTMEGDTKVLLQIFLGGQMALDCDIAQYQLYRAMLCGILDFLEII
jgi:hypothetical protein